MMGCADSLNRQKLGAETVTTNPSYQMVTSISENSRSEIILERRKDTSRVIKRTAGVAEKLFEVPRAGSSVATAAASDKYVMAVVPEVDKLVLYDFNTKDLCSFKPTLRPQAVYFLSDDELLVVGESSTLAKYKINEEQLIKVWSCENLEGAFRVCSDAAGLLYVCTSNKQKVIYVVSPTGRYNKVLFLLL